MEVQPKPLKPPSRHRVLRNYYSNIFHLVEYINVLAGREVEVVVATDPESYVQFLGSVIVAFDGPLPDTSKYTNIALPPTASQAELIDRALMRLFANASSRRKHVLCQGYRQAAYTHESAKADMARMNVANYFVNTNITALQSFNWRLLLERIGENIMLHLLCQTSIFITLENECLCQICGLLISELREHLSDVPDISRPEKCSDRAAQGTKRDAAECSEVDRDGHKRQKLNSTERKLASRTNSTLSRTTSTTSRTNNEQSTKKPLRYKIKPAEIQFQRIRMFYGRAIKGAKSHIIMGLPPMHVLNRRRLTLPSRPPKQVDVVPSSSCFNISGLPPAINLTPAAENSPSGILTKPSEVQGGGLKDYASAVHVSKYIFARQYGLQNAFEFDEALTRAWNYNPDSPVAQRDYLIREAEIRELGPIRTPKRVKPVLGLVHKMMELHAACNYYKVCSVTCPTKLKKAQSTPMDESVILEFMSEITQQYVSFDVSHPSLVVPRGASQAARAVKLKPRFAEFMCSHNEIFRFARRVLIEVIPHDFWGSAANFKVILKCVKVLIASRRYEKLTLHTVLQGFRVVDCDWAASGNKASWNQRTLASDAIKRHQLVEDFVFWIFDSFLMPLLKTTFYVTESSAFRNQVLYFRQDDWNTLCEPLLDRLSTHTFRRLDLSSDEIGSMMKTRELAYSHVRLLPKDTGVRPIVNLKRKSARGSSINSVLKATFKILTYEKNNQPGLLGASVGRNETYSKLKAFQTRLKGTEAAGPKLYFVKVDVQACFDTIDQDRLLDILEKIVGEEGYMIQRYNQISPRDGKTRRSFLQKACPDTEHPHFLNFAAELSASLRHAVFVDKVVYPHEAREHVLKLLREHVTDNIVKIGKDYYRQTVGIPQGSVLSTLLCSFFYGDLESRKFSFRDDPHCLLMRWVDDYLFITTKKERAIQFLKMMNEGHEEYGCFIAKEKTVTNFDCDEFEPNVLPAQAQDFPWCGFLINTTSLHVKADYSRLQVGHIMHTLTVDKGRRPGAGFCRKLLRMARQNSHLIYTDSAFNSEYVVYINIYQNFVLTAMKTHNYIKSWGLSVRRHHKFLIGTIRTAIRSIFPIIRAKAGLNVGEDNRAACTIQKSSVNWLGFHAFHTVLSRKPTMHSDIIDTLARDMASIKLGRNRKQLIALTKEAMVAMDMVAY